ncbi:MAG TPA: glycerophosphodiester phosphodiesterase [Acidimicrobiales bacterium]|nr:glycerophosphodiester phosphodiesterase [Acidimicrobiales bacterium]
MRVSEQGGPGSLPWPRRGPGDPPGVLAHRGGRGPHPENSLAAFADGLRAGADGVELDVRLTADAVAVVHHDPDLPDGRAVAGLDAADLPAEVPTLVAALVACAGKVVDVEIKMSPAEATPDPDHGVARATAELVSASLARPDAPAATLVSSFWPDALATVRAAVPGLATGLLVHPALDAVAALEQAQALGCTTLLPFHGQLTETLVAEAHGRGLTVVTWTVNEPDDLRRAAAVGADAVVTDDVAQALEVLRRS